MSYVYNNSNRKHKLQSKRVQVNYNYGNAFLQ